MNSVCVCVCACTHAKLANLFDAFAQFLSTGSHMKTVAQPYHSCSD